jgi:hypothetical protein
LTPDKLRPSSSLVLLDLVIDGRGGGWGAVILLRLLPLRIRTKANRGILDPSLARARAFYILFFHHCKYARSNLFTSNWGLCSSKVYGIHTICFAGWEL